MAGYGNRTTRYPPIPQERSMLSTGNQAWNTSYNGADAHSSGWSKMGYASNGEEYQDHVCRPVLIDAEGRRRPVIAFNPADGYVIKTETIIEEVQASSLAGYHSRYPAKEAPIKEYAVVQKEWSVPESPSHERRPPEVDDFISKVQTEASRPSKPNILGAQYWRRPKAYTETNDYGGYGDNSSSGWNRPSGNTIRQPYGDASNYDGYGNNNSSGWNRPSGNSIRQPYGDASNYDGYGDNNSSGWNRPSGNTIRQPYGDASSKVSEKVPRDPYENTITATGGWNMPNQGARPKSPQSYDNDLTKPTKDLGTAVEYLKEATTGAERQNRFMAPPPAMQKVDPSKPAIDSKEAAKRYGNLPASRQQFKTVDPYTSTIDSNEVAAKYGGMVL